MAPPRVADLARGVTLGRPSASSMVTRSTDPFAITHPARSNEREDGVVDAEIHRGSWEALPLCPVESLVQTAKHSVGACLDLDSRHLLFLGHFPLFDQASPKGLTDFSHVAREQLEPGTEAQHGLRLVEHEPHLLQARCGVLITGGSQKNELIESPADLAGRLAVGEEESAGIWHPQPICDFDREETWGTWVRGAHSHGHPASGPEGNADFPGLDRPDGLRQPGNRLPTAPWRGSLSAMWDKRHIRGQRRI